MRLQVEAELYQQSGDSSDSVVVYNLESNTVDSIDLIYGTYVSFLLGW